jgi:tetratricopeptide (TPR) repeat protein
MPVEETTTMRKLVSTLSLAAVLACGLAAGAAAMSGGGNTGSAGNGSSDAEEYYQEARGLIKLKNYDGAIPKLLKAVKADPENANINNLLGYAYRKTGDYDNAMKYYKAALAIDPDHADAREYLGEAYVELGDIAKAEEQLAELERICPSGCEQLDELKEKVDAAKATN